LHGTSGRAMNMTMELLMTLGVDLSKCLEEARASGEDGWDVLAQAMARIEGQLWDVRVEHSGNFLNTYVESKPQGVQERMDVPIDPVHVPAATPDDDDIPF